MRQLVNTKLWIMRTTNNVYREVRYIHHHDLVIVGVVAVVAIVILVQKVVVVVVGIILIPPPISGKPWNKHALTKT
jgi:hypothetical protein